MDEQQGAAVPAARRRSSKRFATRRDAFIDAATKVLNEQGLRGMTLAQVSASLGLTTSSATYYFKKKEDLAAACLLLSVDRFDDITRQAERASSPAERIAALVSLHMEMMRRVRIGEERPFAQFNDVRTLKAPVGEPVAAAYLDMFRRVRALFDGGPALARRDLNARTHLLLSLVTWAPGWILNYDPDDHPRVAERVIDILLNGLAQPGVASWPPPRLEGVAPVGSEAQTSREAFLVAATELINEQGYHGASVNRIAERMNVTKGTFYYHNDAKDDLVAECFERTLEIVGRAQRAADNLPTRGWARVSAAAAALCEFELAKHGRLLRTSALSALPPEVKTPVLARFDRIASRFAGAISDGIADGSIRPVDPVIAGRILIGLINAAAEAPAWTAGLGVADVADVFLKPGLVGILST